jgi:hypothetical protein
VHLDRGAPETQATLKGPDSIRLCPWMNLMLLGLV